VSSAARQATKHERIVGGTGSLCHSAQRYASPHIQPEGISMYRKPLNGLLFSFLLGSVPALALANWPTQDMPTTIRRRMVMSMPHRPSTPPSTAR